MDDATLIRAFQDGDEFAFVSLYNRYKGPVHAFCSRMLLDTDRAADATQETFIRLYEHRDRLLKTRSFKAWLFTIARNQCLNAIRKNRRMVPITDRTEHPAAPSPMVSLEKNERIELVGHFMASLSPSYREVLILREYQNLSYDEIAAVTRSTVSAVKSRLFKARRRLAHYLAPYCGPGAPAESSEETRAGGEVGHADIEAQETAHAVTPSAKSRERGQA